MSLLAAGCSRDFYYRQADREAYQLIDCVNQDERWRLPHYDLQPSEVSRFYDPYDPNRPPMPKDDDAAHDRMHRVDGKRGYAHWHANGDICSVENPNWRGYLPLDEQGRLTLTLNDAVEMGLVHSRAYQTQLEELYLSALDVSFERFRFDAQFFGGNRTFFTADGTGASPQGSRSTLRVDNTARMNKLFATGGTLVVDFANAFVFQYSGTNSYTASSNIGFDLIQPLLRLAGREVVMERLTRSERILLYNVRSMERYRQEFYANIASGRGLGQGPSRAGGVFGGAGLEGFTGVGGGGFGQIAIGGGGAAVGAGGAGGAGAAQVGGYLGLLQDQVNIDYLRNNVDSLRNNLEVFRAFEPANLVDPLQVRNAEQSLAQAESQLLNAVAAYETTLDQFKITLGLPPDLDLQIKDDLLEPFVLQSSELIELRNEGDKARLAILPDITLIGDLVQNGRRLETLPEGMRVAPNRVRTAKERFQALKDFRYTLDLIIQARNNVLGSEQFLQGLEAASGLHARTAASVPQVRSQLERLMQVLPQRLDGLRQLGWPDKAERLQADVDQLHADLAAIEKRLQTEHRWLADRESLRQQIEAARVPLEVLDAALKARMERYQKLHDLDAQLQKLNAQYEEAPTAELARQRDMVEEEFLNEFARQEQDLVDLSRQLEENTTRLTQLAIQPVGDSFNRLRRRLDQLAEDGSDLGIMEARARLEAIVLTPIRVTEEQAVCLARRHRLDWMNARGALVDTWRLIDFNADDLESDLDIVFSGDLGTNSDNPFRFRDANGQLRVGLQFDAPITRISERNNYRQSIIEYQQARRQYMQVVDSIRQGLRNTLRTIRVNEENMERRREAVKLAFDQFDFARLRLFAPPQPNVQRNPNIAQDIVTALQSIQLRQTDFLSVWVNSEVQRMILDMDMGTMMLDERGIWLDPGASIGQGDLCCLPERAQLVEELPPDEAAEPMPSNMPRDEAQPQPPKAPPSKAPAMADARQARRNSQRAPHRPRENDDDPAAHMLELEAILTETELPGLTPTLQPANRPQPREPVREAPRKRAP